MGLQVRQAYITRYTVWGGGLCKFTLIVVLCRVAGLGKLTLLGVLLEV